jgi:hypothetical protein
VKGRKVPWWNLDEEVSPPDLPEIPREEAENDVGAVADLPSRAMEDSEPPRCVTTESALPERNESMPRTSVRVRPIMAAPLGFVNHEHATGAGGGQ